jgi:tRNA(fMet)-specific endonuclease VapC
MAVVVADSDVLIDFLTGRGPGAEAVRTALRAGDLVTTVISRFELLSGAQSARQEAKLRLLLERLPALGLDEVAADRVAEVRRSLDRSGEPIGMGDSLVAGIVLANDLALLTRNVKHFSRVRGLRFAQ